jgi:hypothetical protein
MIMLLTLLHLMPLPHTVVGKRNTYRAKAQLYAQARQAVNTTLHATYLSGQRPYAT